MREYGLPASAAAHILLMGAMVFALPGAQPLSVAPEIPVDVISTSQFNAITKGDRNGSVEAAPSDTPPTPVARPEPQPASQPAPLPPTRQPEQTATVDEQPPPPPPSRSKPARPEPKPVAPKASANDEDALKKLAQQAAADAAREEEQKQAAAKAAADKAAAEEALRQQALKKEQEKEKARKTAEARADAEKKAEATKKAALAEADAKRKAAAIKLVENTNMDDLLKKHGGGKSATQAKPPGTVPSRRPSANAGPTGDSVSQTGATPVGTADGNAPKLSISDRDMLQNQINQQVRDCLSPSFGKDGAKDEAKLQLTMNEDGTFAAEPELISASTPAVGNMVMRAVRRCVTADKPLKFRKDIYASWKNFTYIVKPGGF